MTVRVSSATVSTLSAGAAQRLQLGPRLGVFTGNFHVIYYPRSLLSNSLHLISTTLRSILLQVVVEIDGDSVNAPASQQRDRAILSLLCWCRCLQKELSPEAARECYFFNSFFYKKLTEKAAVSRSPDAKQRHTAAERSHERVKKWTKVRLQGQGVNMHLLTGARPGGKQKPAPA